MIDLHSHILPGIDDGATDVAEAIAMARLAVEDGVEVMACTPHFLPGVYDPDPADVLARVAALNGLLLAEGIDLALVAGAEAHIRPGMADLLDRRRILTLNGGRHVLIELPPDMLPPHMDRFFLDLVNAGYKPVLAHVERYAWAERALPFLQTMSVAGVLMQVTAGSLFGDYGRGARQLAMRLLEADLVHLVCSDAHDTRRRPPGLARARDFIAAERGRAEADVIFRHRPEGILLGHLERKAACQTAGVS